MMNHSNYDPTNPSPEVQAEERARDTRLSIDPPKQEAEAEVVRQWLDGDFDYGQTAAMNNLVTAIDASQQQTTTGTN